MSKERIINRVKQQMGEPTYKFLTDEDYDRYYTLSERILTETKINREFDDNVNKLFQRKIMTVLCKDIIEQNLKNDKRTSQRSTY